MNALRRVLIVLAILTLAVSCSGPPTSDIDAPATLALVGGVLLDGTGRNAVQDSVVLIEGERITCAGSQRECAVPASAQIISTEGKWLTPGLVDGHVHFSQTGWVDARPDLVNVGSQYPYDQVMAENSIDPERYYRAYLCSGVTAVFDVGGYTWSWALREHAEHDPLAPHIAATGPLLANFAIPVSTPAEKQFVALESKEAGARMVRYAVANQADAIKLYYIPDAPERLAEFHENIRHFANEADQAGIRFVTHAQSYDAAKFAVESGTSMLVHSIGDRLVDEEFVSLARSQNLLYAPTLTVGEGYEKLAYAVENSSEPEIDDPNGCVDHGTMEKIRASAELGEFVTEQSGLFNDWDSSTSKAIQAANLKQLHDEGVLIVTATDAGNPLTLHGPSIYAEMERIQEAGLSPAEVLVASTRNGAIAMGREEHIGTIEAGKIADILIVTSDPTEDISNMRQLETVIRAGHVHSQESLRASQ